MENLGLWIYLIEVFHTLRILSIPLLFITCVVFFISFAAQRDLGSVDSWQKVRKFCIILFMFSLFVFIFIPSKKIMYSIIKIPKIEQCDSTKN